MKAVGREVVRADRRRAPSRRARRSRRRSRTQTAKRREVVEPGQIGLTLIGFHIPPAKDKDIYALQVASIILGAGESSRLKVRLKSDRSEDQAAARARRRHGGARARGPGHDDRARRVPRSGAGRAGRGRDLRRGRASSATQGPDAPTSCARPRTRSSRASCSRSRTRRASPRRSAGRGSSPATRRRSCATSTRSRRSPPPTCKRVVKQYLTPDNATIVVIPPKGR